MFGFFGECYNCTRRYVNCHSVCQEYGKAKHQKESLNKIIKENKDKERDVLNYIIEGKIKIIKRKN